MKKITFIIAAFALCNGVAQAQTSIGVRAGLNLATWDYTPRTTSSGGSTTYTEPLTTGLSLAIPIELRLSERFAIQPELNFVQKGYSRTATNGSNYSQGTYMFNYLELPILAKIMLGSEKLKLSGLFGPSFGYSLGGRVSSTYKSGGTTTNDVDNIDYTSSTFKQFNRFDIGLVLGVQPSYNITDNGRIFFDLRYQFGLSDIINDIPDDSKVFNRGLGLSVGYLHTLSSK